MRLRNFLRFSVSLAALFYTPSLFAQALKPDDLSSVKALSDPAVTFKRSLRLPTGEISVGQDADNLPASSLLTSYKLDANSFAPGVVTFCPEGMTDNQAKAGCKIIGIVNSYSVNSSNLERWVSEIKTQLIGASPWFITPQNYLQITQSAMAQANISDDVFESCVVRLAQLAEKNSESCFKTKNNNERIALYFRLCHASINGIRGDLIITRADS